MNDRSRCLDVFFKKGVLKNFDNIHKKTGALESPSSKVAYIQWATIEKHTPVEIYYCEFCKIFKTCFFKYTSWQLFLEEHWISLKMMLTAIAIINIFNASYEEFVPFSFLRSVNDKFYH